MKNKLTKLIGIAAFGLAMATINLKAQDTNGIPPQLQAQLPPGAPAFDPNGLSFTNVSYKVAVGTEILFDGTFTYAQGDIDAFKFKSFDLGVGTETTFSASGSGLHSAAIDLEGIKNLSNWQLVGKAGFGRNFESTVGNFAKFGFDVNYNLTKGASLPLLGTTGGAFTYVGAGVSWETSNFSFKTSNNTVQKSFRVYVGWAF